MLTSRPDLMTPVPANVGALASRTAGRLSLDRALDELDQFTLHVIEALAALTAPVADGALAELLGAPPTGISRCLRELGERALAWQVEGGGWRAAPGLRPVIGPPQQAASRAGISPEPPPLPQGFAGGRPPVPAPRSEGPGGPPPGQYSPDGCREVDQAAAAATLIALRCVDDLLARWAAAPPPVLRSGGLGIRELRKAAAAADLDLATAALFTELARSAGLLAASSWANGEWLPAAEFDRWRDETPAQQWATLADAWLSTTRVAHLVGTRDERGRVLVALSTGLDRLDAPRARTRVLRELAGTEPGTPVAAGDMLARLRWRWPRWLGQPQAALVTAALGEAAVLGLTGLGALAAHGRALVCGGGPDAAAKALADVLPEQVSQVLLQADLTAVAPGPLIGALARELSLAADVESTGGAVVYRFCAASVRRALDAGRSGAGLLALLTEHSRTPVPQPLRYLIEDAARRHGRIRVGTATAYLRCDDPAVLAEIAADRRTARLRLHRLAPTVLTAQSGRDEVLAALRQLGYAPAAETADGTVEFTGPPRRAQGWAGRGGIGSPRQPHPPSAQPSWPVRDRAIAAIRVLRTGEG